MSLISSWQSSSPPSSWSRLDSALQNTTVEIKAVARLLLTIVSLMRYLQCRDHASASACVGSTGALKANSVHKTGIHNFLLAKSLSPNGLIPKQSADYYATIWFCLISSLAVLLLCYVFDHSLVFDIFDIICDGITWRVYRHPKQRCASALFAYVFVNLF